ncbi:hypothetical protein ElyMa_001206900 [Elysia marginata]|uniref:Uncharacterized protein n=1 Tax=Elysia marginata TaxID=1093978 RepID=A0AAV4I712_9GAST|nr:hypothetical protein ElyMa_001206900 [Elysia marginata]
MAFFPSRQVPCSSSRAEAKSLPGQQIFGHLQGKTRDPIAARFTSPRFRVDIHTSPIPRHRQRRNNRKMLSVQESPSPGDTDEAANDDKAVRPGITQNQPLVFHQRDSHSLQSGSKHAHQATQAGTMDEGNMSPCPVCRRIQKRSGGFYSSNIIILS